MDLSRLISFMAHHLYSFVGRLLVKTDESSRCHEHVPHEDENRGIGETRDQRLISFCLNCCSTPARHLGFWKQLRRLVYRRLLLASRPLSPSRDRVDPQLQPSAVPLSSRPGLGTGEAPPVVQASSRSPRSPPAETHHSPDACSVDEDEVKNCEGQGVHKQSNSPRLSKSTNCSMRQVGRGLFQRWMASRKRGPQSKEVSSGGERRVSCGRGEEGGSQTQKRQLLPFKERWFYTGSQDVGSCGGSNES